MLGQGDLLRLTVPEGFDPAAVSTGLSLKNKIEKRYQQREISKIGIFFKTTKGIWKNEVGL